MTEFKHVQHDDMFMLYKKYYGDGWEEWVQMAYEDIDTLADMAAYILRNVGTSEEARRDGRVGAPPGQEAEA